MVLNIINEQMTIWCLTCLPDDAFRLIIFICDIQGLD